MIESMTGFGKAVAQLPTKKLTIEIRSLNSKNIDINTRIPFNYKEKELAIRKKLAEKLVRGKVSFTMQIESTGVDGSATINKEIVLKYLHELKELNTSGSGNLLEIAMRLPDVISLEKEEFDIEEWVEIEKSIDKAIEEIIAYRRAEGFVLEKDFHDRIKTISALLEQVNILDPERKKGLKGKLKKAIDDLHQKVDENRFEQELIYYLEKLDITEEQVRLKNHLDYYLEMLNSNTSNGRKLGFITQEMGREINTIGSKANYAPMQKTVIQMKDELEKIKEQNLNIL